MSVRRQSTTPLANDEWTLLLSPGLPAISAIGTTSNAFSVRRVAGKPRRILNILAINYVATCRSSVIAVLSFQVGGRLVEVLVGAPH